MISFFTTLGATVANILLKLLFALVVFFLGRYLIDKLIGFVAKSKALEKIDDSVRTFTLSFVRGALYVLLAVIIVGILGVPMASIITVLASAGVAIGLALQGALSNLAGGIMLMLFKPFKVGDFIETSGVSGVAKEITLFYTTLITLDNKRVTIPNGGLMNANVTDYSAEELRRVDLVFATGKGETPERIQNIMLEAMRGIDKVLSDPEPFARVSGGTNESMEFTARAWCRSEDYWDVYFDMNQRIVEAFGANDVKIPVIRVQNANQ